MLSFLHCSNAQKPTTRHCRFSKQTSRSSEGIQRPLLRTYAFVDRQSFLEHSAIHNSPHQLIYPLINALICSILCYKHSSEQQQWRLTIQWRLLSTFEGGEGCGTDHSTTRPKEQYLQRKLPNSDVFPVQEHRGFHGIGSCCPLSSRSRCYS